MYLPEHAITQQTDALIQLKIILSQHILAAIIDQYPQSFLHDFNLILRVDVLLESSAEGDYNIFLSFKG